MSHKDSFLKLNVGKKDESKIIKDLPRLNCESDSSFESELDESEELEHFSDPNFTPGSCSGSDTEVCRSSFYNTEATPELEVVSPASRGSHEERSYSCAKVTEAGVDKPLERNSSFCSAISSNVPLESHGDIVIENSLLGSCTYVKPDQDIHRPGMAEEITEGFRRLIELVNELLTYENTETEIEAIGQLVKRQLGELPYNSERKGDNWGNVQIVSTVKKEVGVKTCEETNSVHRNKARKKEVWITKCDADLNNLNGTLGNGKLGVNLKMLDDRTDETFSEILDEEVIKFIPPSSVSLSNNNNLPLNPTSAPIHASPPKPSVKVPNSVKSTEKINLCPTSSNIKPIYPPPSITTAKSSPVSFSIKIDATFENENKSLSLLPTPRCSNTTTVSNAPSAVSVPTVASSAGRKSKYEMIREDNIAERNAQLKAMGFFEEFAVLRSDMNPIKPHKVKKKSTEANESHETDVVRRSERLFLSSPEVYHSQSRCITTNAVVEDIIEEMITIACQERIIPDPDHQRITCEECGKRFKKREYMLRHVKFVHRKIFKFHCQHCDYKTYRSSDLIRHMKHHHATLTSEVKQFSQDQLYSDTISKVYSCDKCNFVTKHPKNLPKHMLEVHKIAKEEEIQVHDCDQCCFVTMRRGDLVRHKSRVHREMSNENGGHVHSCDQCNYVTQYSGNLYRHKSSVHNLDKQHKRDVKKEIDRKVLGCDQCNYITNNRGILWRHKSRNHNISNLKVKAKVETTKENSSNDFDFSNLKVMESDSDSVEIFTDDSDDEKASVNLEKQKATCVSEEMKVPSDDKIWSCKTCGKILGNRNNLRRHESRGHNPPDLLECEFLGCAFSTHAKKGMASHKKKHNCERMQCPECGFSTWSEGAFSVHKKWHLGEKLVS